MEWYEMAENPLAISSLYEQVPDLQQILIKEMTLIQSGILEITIELSHLPDKLPSRRNLQRPRYRYLRLRFDCLEGLQISCRQMSSNAFDIKMAKTDDGWISFDAISSHCSLKGTALVLRITWVRE